MANTSTPSDGTQAWCKSPSTQRTKGSRSATGEIGEFKSGLYYLAKKRPDLELIPVHIDNLNRVLPRGEFLPVPLLSCISFGPPMWLERGEAKLDFLARARRAVMAMKE